MGPKQVLERAMFYVGVANDGPNRSRPGAVIEKMSTASRQTLSELKSDDIKDVADWWIKKIIG